MIIDTDDCMEIKEVAALMGIKPISVKVSALRNAIPSVKVGKHRLYLRSQIIPFLKFRETVRKQFPVAKQGTFDVQDYIASQGY